MKFISLNTFRIISLVVALNYFAFRVEIFEEEYEENHPTKLLNGLSLTKYSVNWETFDKDNAPKAFVIIVETTIEKFFLPSQKFLLQVPNTPSFDIIRDKSPPKI